MLTSTSGINGSDALCKFENTAIIVQHSQPKTTLNIQIFIKLLVFFIYRIRTRRDTYIQFVTLSSIMNFCSARLTPEEAMKHPWLLTSTVHSELELDKKKLKRYVIKKRWIKAVNTIIALKRMGAKIDAELL